MSDVVLATRPLGFVWDTIDPFLFCVHHQDHYPKGNDVMGPAASLAGRRIGQDFDGIDGWRMYHGDVVPGFPQHPHRGFETVTFVRRGFVDHSDSLGAAARYGRGDCQWMTAGGGIVHAEMFPLLRSDRDNPVELFQISINLPAEDKLVDPYFEMLWAESIPKVTSADAQGRQTEVEVVAGRLGDVAAPRPAPKSWAARPEGQVAIWTLRFDPGARFTLPAGPPEAHRMLYVFAGRSVRVGEVEVAPKTGVRLRPGVEVELVNGPEQGEALLLQGRPIGEPVAHHGPFVMNTREELMQAFTDYQRTRFGGWPHERNDPVHPRDAGRFARHIDGRLERPG